MGELEACLARMTSEGAEQASSAATKIRDRIERLRRELGDLRTELPRRARRAADAVDELVRQDPWRSLAVVAVAAFVCGLALSRRE